MTRLAKSQLDYQKKNIIICRYEIFLCLTYQDGRENPHKILGSLIFSPFLFIVILLILDPELNDACRSITRCLRPTNVEELYLLAGIALPDIRRDVCARVEKKKQETNAAQSLHGQVPADRRLKRECFLSSVRPADFHAKVIRCSEWQHR